MNFANSTKHKASNLFLASSVATIAISIASGMFLVAENFIAKNSNSHRSISSSNSFPAVTALGDPVGSPAEVLDES